MRRARTGRVGGRVLVERLAVARSALVDDAATPASSRLTPGSARVTRRRWSTGAHEIGRDPRGFLATLAHRRAVDAVRQEEARRRREARVARDEADVPDIADAVLRSDTTGKVRTALDVLPESQRRALELAYFQGYTYRQVAAVLDIPEGTAKSRLRLALARIAAHLGSDVSEESGRWA